MHCFLFKFSTNKATCQDKPGSCKRLLCECDKMFAMGLQNAMQSGYNQDFHLMYTTTNFNPMTGLRKKIKY